MISFEDFETVIKLIHLDSFVRASMNQWMNECLTLNVFFIASRFQLDPLQTMSVLDQPNEIRKKCQIEAEGIVSKHNTIHQVLYKYIYY